MLNETKNGFTATVEYDPHGYTESPREYEESTMFGFHRNVISPDTPPSDDPQEARAIAESRENICLPVWMYDHGARIYKAAQENPFHCPWDSGLFGFIYVSRADARKWYGVKRLTEKNRLWVLDDLKKQVETYSQWANGETFRWEIKDADGDVIDSCGGYYDEGEAESDALGSLTSYAESELAA